MHPLCYIYGRYLPPTETDPGGDLWFDDLDDAVWEIYDQLADLPPGDRCELPADFTPLIEKHLDEHPRPHEDKDIEWMNDLLNERLLDVWEDEENEDAA